MTFAEEDGEKEQVAEAGAQYATTILNKSFICDKTVDVTAKFQQEDEDEKDDSRSNSHRSEQVDQPMSSDEAIVDKP